MDPKDTAPDSAQQKDAEAPAPAVVLPCTFSALNVNARPFRPILRPAKFVPTFHPVEAVASDDVPDQGASEEVTETVVTKEQEKDDETQAPTEEPPAAPATEPGTPSAPASVPSAPQASTKDKPASDGVSEPAASKETPETDDSIMIEYERILERLSPSQLRLGRGSPLGEKLREKIVQQFKNNVSQRDIARNLGISPSTIHNIVKRYKQSGEISARKGQGRKPTLDARELKCLKEYYMKHKDDFVKDISTWAREQFGKPLSDNTVRRLIYKWKSDE